MEVVVTSLCTHKGAVPFGTQPLCSNRKILVIRYCRKVSTVIHQCCWERIWDLLLGMMLMVHLLRNLDI